MSYLSARFITRGASTFHPVLNLSNSLRYKTFAMASTWQPPKDYRNRAVVVLGGGVLGRRIGEFSTTDALSGFLMTFISLCMGLGWLQCPDP